MVIQKIKHSLIYICQTCSADVAADEYFCPRCKVDIEWVELAK